MSVLGVSLTIIGYAAGLACLFGVLVCDEFGERLIAFAGAVFMAMVIAYVGGVR